MLLLDISTFLGRLHPIAVHLPIGFLLLAALFQWASSFSDKFIHLKASVSVILGLGAIAAIVSCFLGWLLSNSGDYSLNILENHKYTGIALAVITSLLFFFSTDKGKSYFQIPNTGLSVIYAGIVGLMSYTGHQGGNLTHGTEYLSLAVLTETVREPPASLETVLIYEDLVEPILDRKCVQCHQSGKKKGELLMTSYEALLKGGKHGEIIIAGNTEESDILRRVNLDDSHEEFMPTDGKTPLTKIEKEILTWWIKNGAPAKETKFLDQAYHKEALSPVEVYLGFKKGVPELKKGEVAVNPDIPMEADISKIEAIEQAGFNVRIMNYEPLMLDVAISYGNEKGQEVNLKNLVDLAPHIIWLNASNSSLENSDLAPISEFVNIEKIRLEGNPIDSKSISYFAKLKHLNAINLNETKVGKEVLEDLAKLPSLKRIYVWKTTVSENDIKSILQPNADLEIIL